MLLTQDDVSRLLSVSRDTVKRLRKTGHLPTVKIGRSVRIPQGAVQALMEERKWARGNCHQDLSQTNTGTTMCITTQGAEAREKAFGQTIYSQQKVVSQGGLRPTTKIT